MLEKLYGLAVLVASGVLYSDAAHDTSPESYVQTTLWAHAAQVVRGRFLPLLGVQQVILVGVSE